MAIKLICSDCNGVLNNVDRDYSKTGFYSTINRTNADLYGKITDFLFGGKVRHLGRSWMSGEISYKELNNIISKRLNCDCEYLNQHLEESARLLELNWDLIGIYQKYRKKNVKVVITSDNMDVFSEQTVPHNNLKEYFDEIYNSADLGYLKETNNFELYRKIAEENRLELSQVLVIDDTEKLINNAKNIGFSTYLYNEDTFSGFEDWLDSLIK